MAVINAEAARPFTGRETEVHGMQTLTTLDFFTRLGIHAVHWHAADGLATLSAPAPPPDGPGNED